MAPTRHAAPRRNPLVDLAGRVGASLTVEGRRGAGPISSTTLEARIVRHARHRPVPSRGPLAATSRLAAIALLPVVLAGCATQAPLSSLPPPPWPAEPREAVPAGPIHTPATAGAEPWRDAVVPRARWARGEPLPVRMDRMLPIRTITVHHDGMDAFRSTDMQRVADRLERIRHMHRQKGWGDIGYHFAVDPAGRIWEARPLRYQGAHVKDHNPGNIGIVALGNFEVQSPTQAQLEGLRRCLHLLMQAYGVAAGQVHTHREWPGAATACPGDALQAHVERIRRS
jgi:hypothetical protein